MKKRFLSLLCVLALCLGLLPVTALAVGEIELYVGGQQIKESGCYENKSGTWTKVDGTEPANGQFSYDAATATLTLNQAKIVNYQDVTVGGGFTYPGSVIAFSQSADVSLTIVVSQGTSNITGTGGIRVVSKAGDASLSISGPGSLEVNVDKNDSGITLIGSKNVNLNIDGADVKTLAAYYYGVDLHAGDGFKAAAVVNNGKLTAGGSGGIGIYYRWTNPSDSGTSSLTVSGNAVVDTRDSKILIASEASKVQVGAGSDGNGGIVFDGKNGTVYGDVELQDDLTINEGETLTIGKDASLTVPDGKTLTNNGTVTTEEGGTLTGNITNAPPKINTTNPLPDGTVGTVYNQQLAAENTPTQWSVTSGPLPAGLTLNGNTISGTPTTANTYKFTVTATNNSGSDSKEFTLTINPAPVLVTGVTLEPTSLTLFTGDTASLTATVEPSNATNPNVTWSSDRSDVATVDSGVVTAVGEGEATITVKTTDGSNISDTCTVTVTQSTYSISADTKALDFGSVYTGYTQPAAKTVTITNDGNQQVTVTPPTANDFVITAGTGFTDSTATLAPKGTATFTVQPKAGLSVGTYSENITVSGSEGATVTIPANFTVEQRDNTPYYGITVNAPANGTVTCYAKSAAKGAEVTLTVKPDVGYALDKLTVTDASGKTVDVTKVDEKTYTFVMPACAVTVEAFFAPGATSLPFTDVSAGDWFYEAVQFVYENGLMDGVGNNLFAPNATLNRAMAVTILYRLEGSPDLDGENLGYPFADVDGDTWYSDAVYWARLNGIVDGVENNHFDPTGSLTREQMATILYRYAQYKGADVSASGDISGFADSANVSSWAVDAVKWAVGSGLVNGVEGNALAPQGTSTRAQAAAVLMRLSQAMGV